MREVVLLLLGCGGSFLLVGMALLMVPRRARASRRRIERSGTDTAAELRELVEAAAGAAGPGFLTTPAKLTGVVAPGEEDPVVAEQSGVPCVWFRLVVIQHYLEWYRDLWRWRLDIGTTVFVAGEAHDRSGRLQLTAPDGGDLLMTVQTEQEHLTTLVQERQGAIGCAVVALVLGAVAVALGVAVAWWGGSALR